MFTGHTAIVLLFLVSAFALSDQQSLAQLPENFPSSCIIGIAFGFVVSYSFIIQLYLVLLVVAALGPLYFATYPERTGNMYLYTLIALLIFKIWNLLANWWMLKVHDATIRYIDAGLRFVFNCAVFYFAVS